MYKCCKACPFKENKAQRNEEHYPIMFGPALMILKWTQCMALAGNLKTPSHIFQFSWCDTHLERKRVNNCLWASCFSVCPTTQSKTLECCYEVNQLFRWHNYFGDTHLSTSLLIARALRNTIPIPMLRDLQITNPLNFGIRDQDHF